MTTHAPIEAESISPSDCDATKFILKLSASTTYLLKYWYLPHNLHNLPTKDEESRDLGTLIERCLTFISISLHGIILNSCHIFFWNLHRNILRGNLRVKNPKSDFSMLKIYNFSWWLRYPTEYPNNQHNDIKFTVEIECNKFLPFIDILVSCFLNGHSILFS